MKENEFFDGKFDEISKMKETKNLKKRKLFEIKTLVYYLLEKGEDFKSELVQLKADLTMEDIVNGTYLDKSKFKALNL